MRIHASAFRVSAIAALERTAESAFAFCATPNVPFAALGGDDFAGASPFDHWQGSLSLSLSSPHTFTQSATEHSAKSPAERSLRPIAQPRDLRAVSAPRPRIVRIGCGALDQWHAPTSKGLIVNTAASNTAEETFPKSSIGAVALPAVITLEFKPATVVKVIPECVLQAVHLQSIMISVTILESDAGHSCCIACYAASTLCSDRESRESQSPETPRLVPSPIRSNDIIKNHGRSYIFGLHQVRVRTFEACGQLAHIEIPKTKTETKDLQIH
jgi:hypothetical protein